MIKFGWYRRFKRYFGYRTFFKGWPDVGYLVVRGDAKMFIETIIDNGWIEET